MRKWKLFNKPIFTVIFCLLMLFTVCGISFAWYQNMRNIAGTERFIKSDSHDISVEGYTAYCSDEAGIDNNNVAIKLASYDSVFGRNDKTPVYLVIPVSGAAIVNKEDLKVTISCNGDFSEIKDGKGTVVPNLSNVVQVKCLLSDAKISGYDSLRSLFKSKSELDSYVFVEYELNDDGVITSYSKNQNVSFAIGGTDNTGTVYLLIEIDYNSALCSKLLINRFGKGMSGRLDKVKDLKLSEDLVNITVETAGG